MTSFYDYNQWHNDYRKVRTKFVNMFFYNAFKMQIQLVAHLIHEFCICRNLMFMYSLLSFRVKTPLKLTSRTMIVCQEVGVSICCWNITVAMDSKLSFLPTTEKLQMTADTLSRFPGCQLYQWYHWQPMAVSCTSRTIAIDTRCKIRLNVQNVTIKTNLWRHSVFVCQWQEFKQHAPLVLIYAKTE